MKILSVILTFLILSLSTRECYGLQFSDNLHHIEKDCGNNHDKSSHDDCSFSCICYCCGKTISFHEIAKLNVVIATEIPSLLVAVYQTTYKFDNLFNIWQPPKVNS